MKRSIRSITFIIVFLSLLLVVGCSGGGISGILGFGKSGSGGNGTTTIAGKVTLSSSVLGRMKPSTQAKAAAGKNFIAGKPGSPAYLASRRATAGSSLMEAVFGNALNATSLTNAAIDLYDANHPEWLLPVASTRSDSSGDYTLDKMINAEYNKGAAYQNDDPIPAGLYTLVAYKIGVGTKAVVSVQAVVNDYDGFESVDFEVVDSDVEPVVEKMFGVNQNNDGTNTFGSSSLMLATNTSIQISFSMPMWRDSLSGISISPAVEGSWSLSADWRTATFYLKSGTTLDPNTLYTVRVNGGDTTDPVYNVYTNPVRKTVIGYFTTTNGPDTQSPTAQWLSPSLYEMSQPLKLDTPIRIMVNEPLDVNGMYLEATPSLGARTSVIFIGSTTENGNKLYVYEFGLGSPLMLNTRYQLRVVGGKDLAGNALNTLVGSITTKAASAYTSGIDANASPDTQKAQAEIYDVFGKWTRSMNDRNLALFQSLMTGDFYMEYNVTQGVSSDDTNHDGRYSLYEFTEMITKVFKNWEYCGSTITGQITPGTYITLGQVDPNTGQLDMSLANLEFKLDASSEILSQSCTQNAPTETLYMTLKKVYLSSTSYVWMIRRASEGIDNRAKIPSLPDYIDATLYKVTAGTEKIVGEGGQLDAKPSSSYGLKFKWAPVTGVQGGLVLAMIDAKTSCTGLAFAFDNDKIEVDVNASTKSGIALQLQAANGTDVTASFNLDGMRCENTDMGNMQTDDMFIEGGEYYWELIGLRSTPTGSIADTNAQDLVSDISAISSLKRFTIAGLYKELTAYVATSSGDATYSDVLKGYDVGSAATVALTVYSPNINTTGILYIWGHSQQWFDLTFDASGKAVVPDIPLFQGVNRFWMSDNMGLYKYFTVYTKGGIAPAITFQSVSDDSGDLTSAGWDYYQAHTGATYLKILGNVNPYNNCSISGDVYYQIYNWKLGAWSQGQATPDNSGTFVFDKIEIYKGENWISIYANDTCNYNSREIGIVTDTGSPWVPPISVTSVTRAQKTVDYQTGSDWDASNDADNTVSIKTKFKTCATTGEIPTASYSLYSEGGDIPQSGLNVDNQGVAFMSQQLYHGMTTIYFNSAYPIYSSGQYPYDPSCFSSSYALRINTTAGRPVVKTEITSVDGYNLQGATSYWTFGCSATLTGKAEPGLVKVYWRGFNGVTTYTENYRRIVSDSDSRYSVQVPLTSGGYNAVDVYNQNNKTASVTLYTYGNCPYTAPTLSTPAIKVTDMDGTTVLTKSGSYWMAQGRSQVKIQGVSSKPGQMITATSSQCSRYTYYSTNASTSGSGSYAWTLPVDVYQGNHSFQVTDGRNYVYVYINGDTSRPYPPVNTHVTSIKDADTLADLSFTEGACGYVTANTGSAVRVNILGTTTEPDGSRGYYSMNQDAYPVSFTGGAYSISNLPVYSYPNTNNYLYLYNAYGYRIQNVTMTSSNNVYAPRFVEITSPVHNATITAAPTITGRVLDPTSSGFNPTYFYAWVYDSGSGWGFDYSSDTYEQTQYGYKKVTVTPGSGGTPTTFSLTTDDWMTGPFDPNNFIEVDVYAYDEVLGIAHEHYIVLNNAATNWDEYYYKLGFGSPGSREAADAQRRSEYSIERIRMYEAMKHLH